MVTSSARARSERRESRIATRFFSNSILTSPRTPVLSNSGSADFFCGEDGKLDERRFFSAYAHQAIAHNGRHNGRVVDPEMDMKREGIRPAPLSSRLSRIMRWLMPESRQVAPPMRSVARELEEAFPSADN
jgi:hypothetical protein